MKNSKPTPAYYAIIPAPVRYDNTLTDKAKILYGELTTFQIFTDIALLTINIFPKYAK